MTKIQSRVYRLVKPRQVVETLVERVVRKGQVVVEPAIGSICHADLRYFTGKRRLDALERKLPMALVHEGIGRIVESTVPELKRHQRVVIVPNIPGYVQDGTKPEDCCPACRSGIGDNYCYRGAFLGSGTDGIAQERLVLPAACAVPVPEEVPDPIAVLAELCSVSYHALRHVVKRLEGGARIAVFGDGPVGYLAAAVLHYVYRVPAGQIHVFGADAAKLAQFDFVGTRSLVQQFDFASGASCDIAVECTGGRFSEQAINQAIDILYPGGHIILMGVSEERVPVNTRDVLERGITLKGSSRSSSADFPPVLEAMKDAGFQHSLRKLLPAERKKVARASDFIKVMEEAEQHRSWQKILMEFEWR
jgi:ribitol-5-phosphate 2-dehydrogenase